MARRRAGALGWLAVTAAVLALPGCYHGGAGAPAPHPRVKEAQDAARQAIAVEAQLKPDTLSPKTVGVLPFDQTGLDSSTAALGYGLADLLRVDLAKSSQLRIVDRLRLDAIMRELALASSGVRTRAPRRESGGSFRRGASCTARSTRRPMPWA